MQRRGLIDARWSESGLGKRVKVYDLTPAGRRTLQARVADWGQLTSAVAKVLRMG
jgi:DNA-binding PadR family transcriptional regulator